MKRRLIKPLAAQVRARIAAGQVIERPASVLKELLENALDAGATHIAVSLEDGGKKRIRVVDNGHGMHPEELSVAISQYTTSKIETVADLGQVRTFGFRGEALYSMGLVAKVVLASRPQDQPIGAAITVSAGTHITSNAEGMPYGTIVTVSELFRSVPARKKFLKSAGSEYARCLQTFIAYVVAYPKVAFTLEHNGKRSIELVSQTTEARFAQVVRCSSSMVIPFSFSDDHITLTGLLGAPQLAGKSTTKQFITVNDRPVMLPVVTARIKAEYGGLLEPRSYPVCLLQITIHPEMIDVNVTPKKDTIRFYNEAKLLALIGKVLSRVLASGDWHYTGFRANKDSLLQDTTMNSDTAALLRSLVEPWQVHETALTDDIEIAQVHNLYLVVQTTEGIMVIDQHAAHERILYEQFLAAFKQEKSNLKTKELPKPVSITLPVTECEAIARSHEVLARMGFELACSSTKITVMGVPPVFAGRNLTVLFAEFAADVLEDRPLAGIDSVSHRTLAFLACRTAIKAGETLTQSERKRLVEKLLKTPARFTCPHGRPTIITFSLSDLHKLFKRLT